MSASMTPWALSAIRAASNRPHAQPADFERHLTDEQRRGRAQQEALMRAGLLRRPPTAFMPLEDE